MMHEAHPIGKNAQSMNYMPTNKKNHRSACMRFSPQFLCTAAPSKCYWIYTKECYITEQNEITETSVITRIS